MIGEAELQIRDLQYTDDINKAWMFRLVTEPLSVRVEAKDPGGKSYEVWVEVSDGKFVVLCFDPGHDEPLRVRITSDGSIVTDDERGGDRIEHI